MATQVPRPKIVHYIIDTLRRSGGSARGSQILRAYNTEHGRDLRCLSSYVSDCRKLGAEIRYNTVNDTLTLVSGPTRTAPVPRKIDGVVAAVHRAEEWLARTRRGMIDTEAVRLLVREVKKYRDIPSRHAEPRDPFEEAWEKAQP